MMVEYGLSPPPATPASQPGLLRNRGKLSYAISFALMP
jgi:hypothetical protein